MEKWTPDKIRSLRLRMGWSAAELARRFGGQADLITRWELGECEPTSVDRLQLEQLACVPSGSLPVNGLLVAGCRWMNRAASLKP